MALTYYYKVAVIPIDPPSPIPLGAPAPATTRLVGPLTFQDISKLRTDEELPLNTPVVRIDDQVETWLTLDDPSFAVPEGAPDPADDTTQVSPAPVVCFFLVFGFLGYVASLAAYFANPIAHVAFFVVEWIYGIATALLFRYRRGTPGFSNQFWYLLIGFTVYGLIGLAISLLQD